MRAFRACIATAAISGPAFEGGPRFLLLLLPPPLLPLPPLSLLLLLLPLSSAPPASRSSTHQPRCAKPLGPCAGRGAVSHAHESAASKLLGLYLASTRCTNSGAPSPGDRYTRACPHTPRACERQRRCLGQQGYSQPYCTLWA